MSWTCEEWTLSRNALISSTYLHSFGRRAIKEEGWEGKCSKWNSSLLVSLISDSSIWKSTNLSLEETSVDLSGKAFIES